MVASLKREEVSGDDFPQRRPYIETLHSKQDEDFNVPLVHMAHMLYPPLLYQHQSKASGFHLQQQRSCLPDKSLMFNGTSNVKQTKHYQINGSSASILNNSTRIDSWGLSADWSSLDGTLTEDDILKMVQIFLVRSGVKYFSRGKDLAESSLADDCLVHFIMQCYEQYLEAHSQSSRKFHHSVKSNQERIVEAGALTSLLTILKNSNDETIRRVAAGAIANLAMNGGMKVKAGRDESSPYAAMLAAQDVSQRCKELGINALHIKLRATGGNKTKTPGPGTKYALRALARSGMIGRIGDIVS